MCAHKPVGCAPLPALYTLSQSSLCLVWPRVLRVGATHMPVGFAALQQCASYGQGRYMHLQLIGLSAVLLLSTAHTLPLSSLCLVWAGMLCAHVLICVLAVLPCSTVPRMAKGAMCMCAHRPAGCAASQHCTHSHSLLRALYGQACCVYMCAEACRLCCLAVLYTLSLSSPCLVWSNACIRLACLLAVLPCST